MQRWQRTLLIMFMAQLLSAVGFSMIFPFLPLYVEDLGVASGVGSVAFWAAMVFSVQGLTMMIASPFWGALADRYGRKPMVERAMFGGAVIILLMGFARSAEELVLLRAIQGGITGVVSAAAALVAATAPRERTGYAMGLLQVGLWSGVAVGPLIGGVMADTFGYRLAFSYTAALLLAGGLLVHFGVHEAFTPATTHRRGGLLAAWVKILAVPGVRIIYLIRFLSWLGRTLVIPFAPLFIASLLASGEAISTLSGLMIGLSSASGTASAIVLGRLGDRVGHRRIIVISSAAAALCYLPQSLVQEVWQLIVLYTVTGAAIGGTMTSVSALLAQRATPGDEGSTFGIDNAIGAAAKAVSPLVGAGIVA